MKLFANSRGYTVSEAFSQCIYPNPVTDHQGFTFADYKAEIVRAPGDDQVQGHDGRLRLCDTGSRLLARHLGYNPTRPTMPWGGYYNNGQNMRHWRDCLPVGGARRSLRRGFRDRI